MIRTYEDLIAEARWLAGRSRLHRRLADVAVNSTDHDLQFTISEAARRRCVVFAREAARTLKRAKLAGSEPR